MSKLLAERLKETKRLTILQLLASVEGRRIDLATLGLALRDLGQPTERSVLESEIRWMDRQGLVQLVATAGAPIVALTEKGDMAQLGDIEEPGVARPALP